MRDLRSTKWFKRLPCRAGFLLLTGLWLGCSSGGAVPASETCSATRACPENLVCMIDTGVCVPPYLTGADLAGALDLGGPTLDMGMPPPPNISPSCLSPHLCWENPLPQGLALYKMWGVGPNDMWAVGALGVAIHWDGKQWTRFDTGTEQTLHAVWGRATNQMWAVGNGGTIVYWDGSRFTVQPSDTTSSLYDLWGSATTLWAVGENGTVVKGDGTSWSSVTSGTAKALYAIWGSSSTDVWAVGSDNCHFGGTTWTCANDFDDYAAALAGAAPNDIWALGHAGKAWHWNGTVWEKESFTTSAEDILSAYALGPSDIWAAGSHGLAWHYDGKQWTSTKLGAVNHEFNGVFATGPNRVYVVGDGGEIAYFDGAWKPLSSGFSTADVVALWGVSDHDLWAFTSGDTDNAHHYDGSVWTTTTLPGAPLSATGTSSRDIWVGGDQGRVYRYDGTRWNTLLTHDLTSANVAVFAAAADRVVVAGAHAVEFWDGARFTANATPSGGATAVWGSGPSDLWAAPGASDCAVARFDGTKWTKIYIDIKICAVTSIHGTSPTDVYFTGDGISLPAHWDGSRFSVVPLPPLSGGTVAVYATPTRVFLTNESGEIFTGLGTTWTKIGWVQFALLKAITGWGPDQVWIGGSNGDLLSYKP